ncbi:MAG: hypothetical protein IKN39_03975 [Clostridia bacterium]|nr:hypothetical protein [Clostridia bacterium]
MKIAKPELKVVRFASEDVIATSLFALRNGANYDIYSGAVDSTAPDANGRWHINWGSQQYTWNQTEFDENKTNILLNPLYDAYYEDGNYYTNGVYHTETDGSSAVVNGPEAPSGFQPGPSIFP